MQNVAAGFMKALMFWGISFAAGFGLTAGSLAAWKLMGPLHIDQTTTVRHVE